MIAKIVWGFLGALTHNPALKITNAAQQAEWGEAIADASRLLPARVTKPIAKAVPGLRLLALTGEHLVENQGVVAVPQAVDRGATTAIAPVTAPLLPPNPSLVIPAAPLNPGAAAPNATAAFELARQREAAMAIPIQPAPAGDQGHPHITGFEPMIPIAQPQTTAAIAAPMPDLAGIAR